MSLRVVFLGNDPWSVPSLEAIDDDPGLAIAMVLTNPPRPAGRGGNLRPTEVAAAARSRGLPLTEAEGVRDGAGAAALRDAQADVLAVVAYGELLRPAELTLAPHGAVNLHFSLLPRWRGAAPVQRALMAGDEITGVTVMRMDEGLDTGPVLRRRPEPVRPDDDAGSLGMRLAVIGAIELVATLGALQAGTEAAEPQHHAEATAAPRIEAAERVIDWGADAYVIAGLVRGLAPEPGATTTFRGQPVKILALATTQDGPAEADPGALIGTDDDGVLVATGDGVVRLLTVAPAGRKRMGAAAWARGARFRPGDRLG